MRYGEGGASGEAGELLDPVESEFVESVEGFRRRRKGMEGRR